MTSMWYLHCMQNPDVADRSLVVTPHAIPWDASLTLKCRVRHPSRKTTREYWTINARVPHGTQMQMRMLTMGDFGRWAVDDRATAEAALIAARIDLRVRRATVFKSLAELVEAPYTPTLSDAKLADAYDAEQERRGIDRRASRRN